MIPTSTAFADAVRNADRKRATRLLLLTSLLVPTDVLSGDRALVLDGSVTIDRTRQQRRTMSLTISNENGAWTPSPSSPLFLNRIVQVQRALYVGSQPEWVPLGTFLIDDPEVTVSAGGSSIRLAGTDRTKLALSSNFTAPYTLGAGTRVRDAVRALAQQAGMGSDDRLYSLDDGGKFLGTDATFEESDNRLDAMMRLAQDYALDLYPDALGVLVLRPLLALETVAPVWTFERGSQAIMLGLTKRFSDATLFNHTVAIGEGVDFGPYRGEARDLNPASPVYNPVDGSGPVGDRVAPVYRSAGITSIAQAQEVAQAMLRDVALVQEAVSVPSVTHPALEAGDVVQITEATSATAARYSLDVVTQPVGGGPMQLSANRVRSLAA